MYRVSGVSIMAASLCLMLGAAPSFAGPPNNDVSVNGSTAGGTGALASNPPSARNNTAFGSFPLNLNTTGIDNTAFGADALQNNNAGENTAVGSFALFHNTSGGDNTAVGFHALWNNFVGGSNTAVGSNALASSNSGGFNTAVGALALVVNTTGVGNTAFGAKALNNNISGNDNTAIGLNALFSATGSNNIALGTGAGFGLTSGTNDMYVGSIAGSPTESDTIRLGQTQKHTFVAGIFGTPVSGSQVLVTSTGQLGILASSARYKRDISAMGARSRGLFALRPVTFRYKQDRQRIRQYGLIAEEVAKVYPELVTRRNDGTVESVQYHELIAMLLNELQRQQRELTELKATSARLQATVAEQTAVLKTRSLSLAAAAASPKLGTRKKT